MVKISVIIPVYNAEEFLDEAINSVLNQTLSDIELVCVNDGSKDHSLRMLEDFAKKDKRIKLIDQENAGCGAARNRALDDAEGDYIYFFDPDDYILPNTFEELYNNAINNDSDLVIFKIARFKDKEEINYSIPGFEFEKVFKNVDFDNFTFDYHDARPFVMNTSFAPWTKLYKKSFLDKYGDFRFPTNIAFDDAPFHIQSMLRAAKISYVPEFFYFYRYNPNSIINTSSNGIDIFKICDIVENFLKENKFYCEFIEEFKLFKIGQILNYMLSTDSEEYFQMAKTEFGKIYIGQNNLIPKHSLNRFNLVLKSKTFEQYKSKEYDLQIKELKQRRTRLKNTKKSLTNENKKLKRQLKKEKKLSKTISNSKSWKITKPIRSFTNIFR